MSEHVHETNYVVDGLLDSLEMSVVSISSDQTICGYSKCAASLLGLTDDMIGMPLSAVCPAVSESELASWIAEAAKSEQCIRKEIQTADRQWLEVRICASEVKVDDCRTIWMLLNDISERKLNELRLEDIRNYSESVIQTVREPLLVLDQRLCIRDANQAFYHLFRVTEEETTGRYLYDLGNRQWDIPQLTTLLEDILPSSTQFNDFEVEHVFPAIGRRIMLLNARQVDWKSEHRRLILLAIEDITERQTAKKELEAAYERAPNRRDSPERSDNRC